MRAVSWTVVGLSLLMMAAAAYAAAIRGSSASFMEIMYSNLSSQNLSTWIYPPKENNKSALYRQVDSLCQSNDRTEELETPIHYACASMLEIILKMWATPNMEKIITEKSKEIQRPKTLDDLYKEEDLKHIADFCHHFTRDLNVKDFDPKFSTFLKNFNQKPDGKGENLDSCVIVCKNAEKNDSVIALGEVNPVCAIWRKGYVIYRVVSDKIPLTSVPVADSNSPKPFTKVESTLVKENGDNHGGEDDVENIEQLENSKKRKELFSETNKQTTTNIGKESPSPFHPAEIAANLNTNEKSKTPQMEETSRKNEIKTSEQIPQNNPDEKKEEYHPKDKVVDMIFNQKEKTQSGNAKVSAASSSSSSTPSSVQVPVELDVPPPPVSIAKEKSSSPKTVESNKGKSSSPSNAVKPAPPNQTISPINKPTEGSIAKVEQPSQNEPPIGADYEDGDGVASPNANDGPKMYDTDDDSVIDADKQDFRQKPKGQSQSVPQDTLSVSVSKEKHTGDNVQVDKVSIEGDSATVNVAFNEQSDPGVINYFVCFLGILAILYLLFHNKKRLIAYVVEGRKPQTGRRRSSSTQYRKLENNYD